MSRSPLRIVTAAMVLLAGPAVASSVSTAWVQLPSDNHDACVATGSRAVEGAGFRVVVSQDRQTIFGWRGEEALTVRCISAHRIAVVFAWVTDEANDSGRLVESVTAAYRNRGFVGGGGSPGGGNLGGGNPGGGNLGGGNLGGGNPGGGGIVKR